MVIVWLQANLHVSVREMYMAVSYSRVVSAVDSFKSATVLLVNCLSRQSYHTVRRVHDLTSSCILSVAQKRNALREFVASPFDNVFLSPWNLQRRICGFSSIRIASTFRIDASSQILKIPRSWSEYNLALICMSIGSIARFEYFLYYCLESLWRVYIMISSSIRDDEEHDVSVTAPTSEFW